ncbi:hypothetical protein K0M31_011234, partial [Melipona bicolor]
HEYRFLGTSIGDCTRAEFGRVAVDSMIPVYRLIHVRFPAKPDVSEPTLKSILIHSLRTNGGLRPQRENRSRSLIFEGDNFSPVAKAAAD